MYFKNISLIFNIFYVYFFQKTINDVVTQLIVIFLKNLTSMKNILSFKMIEKI